MKNSKLFLENKIMQEMEFGGYISSKSEPDKKHFVYYSNGKWNCDCIAGSMFKECSHQVKMEDKIKEYLIKTNDNLKVRGVSSCPTNKSGL